MVVRYYTSSTFLGQQWSVEFGQCGWRGLNFCWVYQNSHFSLYSDGKDLCFQKCKCANKFEMNRFFSPTPTLLLYLLILQILGFIATIVYCIYVYLTFNSLTTYLKQEDSSNASEPRKSEGRYKTRLGLSPATDTNITPRELYFQ